MNPKQIALDIASLFSSDPDRGKRVLAYMKATGLSLDVEEVEVSKRYAERVWHGLERAPE